jgi:hypothetical protein
MIRAAALSFVLLATPMACVASPPAADTEAPEAQGGCDAKPTTPPSADAASPADAPTRHSEVVPARPASARSPGTVRTATPRWNRLLPGMFR